MHFFPLIMLLGIGSILVSRKVLLDNELNYFHPFTVLTQNWDNYWFLNPNNDEVQVSSLLSIKNKTIKNPTLLIDTPVEGSFNSVQSSSQPFIFADHRALFQPNFTSELSFSEYEQRLQLQLRKHMDLEVLCYKEKRSNCLSARKEKKQPKAIKPYSESELRLHYQDYPIQLQVSSCNGSYLIGIPISPSQFAERQAIRATWCKTAIQCIFFCGQSEIGSNVDRFIKEESLKYDDIVQFGFQNSYLNLTILQLSTYSWISHHCPNLTYFIRADSDIFINLPRLLTNVLSTPKTGFAYGHVFQRAKPIRDRQSKWFMPHQLYAGTVFPPYLSGCMYVWSKDVLEKVLHGSRHVHPMHYIDDVFFGQVFKATGIRLQDDSKDIYTVQLPISSRLWKRVTVAHRYSPIDLLTIWKLYST